MELLKRFDPGEILESSIKKQLLDDRSVSFSYTAEEQDEREMHARLALIPTDGQINFVYVFSTTPVSPTAEPKETDKWSLLVCWKDGGDLHRIGIGSKGVGITSKTSVEQLNKVVEILRDYEPNSAIAEIYLDQVMRTSNPDLEINPLISFALNNPFFEELANI